MVLFLCGCFAPGAAPLATSATLRGYLLLIGGGLEDDNKPVYERFVALARECAGAAAPRIVIVAAASLNQENGIKSKRESLHAYCPDCGIDAVLRETSAADTVRLVEAAHGLFFTGGDQKRITQRYLNGDRNTPDAAAMRRLLARGGVIAGTSAGDAMMSDPMFLTGRSAAALGIRSTATPASRAATPDEDQPAGAAREAVLGPQIGRGMGFLPWAIADSHFFERHRFGRLVAALEKSGKRLGIGVSENACVEVDLARGELIGLSAAESLLVDVGGLEREGLTRRNVRTRVIRQGMRLSLTARLATPSSAAPPQPRQTDENSNGETESARRLDEARFFRAAEDPSSDRAQRLRLDGYEQLAWPDGAGDAIVELRPLVENR